jgi:hypothetical protein
VDAGRVGVHVTPQAERLIRSEPFRRLHRRVVAALEEVGDTGTLSGIALARALSMISTPASFQGTPRPSVATSAGVL